MKTIEQTKADIERRKQSKIKIKPAKELRVHETIWEIGDIAFYDEPYLNSCWLGWCSRFGISPEIGLTVIGFGETYGMQTLKFKEYDIPTCYSRLFKKWGGISDARADCLEYQSNS